jgi:hypothetical protein
MLHPHLCLFGDSAYINSFFLATPFIGRCEGAKDSYNFHHSQIRINIECAFGVFVKRWGILRTALRSNMGVRKINMMVVALAKLHNFCIDEKDLDVPDATARDSLYIETNHSGYIDNGNVEEEVTRGGHHFDDVGANYRRNRERAASGVLLPRDRIYSYINENGYMRPNLRIR